MHSARRLAQRRFRRGPRMAHLCVLP